LRPLIIAALACAASSALAISGLSAQPVYPRGTARVTGTVTDARTGRPILRAWICRKVELNAPYGHGMLCASPDSTGRYLLDSLPDGPQVVTVQCSGRMLLSGRLLRQDTLDLSPGEEARIDVLNDGLGCDMRPLTVRRGVFRGRYQSGFESSSFRPCGDSVTAWTEFSPAARDSGPKWPNLKGEGYPTYYVRWQGTRTGPWHYGHLGGASYEMRVDRVLEVRRPRRWDCR